MKIEYTATERKELPHPGTTSLTAPVTITVETAGEAAFLKRLLGPTNGYDKKAFGIDPDAWCDEGLYRALSKALDDARVDESVFPRFSLERVGS